jgi:hypothetical protein
MEEFQSAYSKAKIVRVSNGLNELQTLSKLALPQRSGDHNLGIKTSRIFTMSERSSGLSVRLYICMVCPQ